MGTSHFIYFLISAVLGLALAIPSNACIVIVNLQNVKKKVKLSPSDVIFLAKGTVNLIIQAFTTLQGMLLVFYPKFMYSVELYMFMSALHLFLVHFSFWLTAWLSAHYCTSITNLNYRVFIWLKGIVSNFLSQCLILTALVLFVVTFPTIWTLNAHIIIQPSKNISDEAFVPGVSNNVWHFFVLPLTFLGCILPFCLSLLCLLLTLSYLIRHVWRVKSNDSGSVRPKLQAHVTALRTIFFLLFIFTSFSMSQVILFFGTNVKITDPIGVTSWTLRLLSPSTEAAIILQASNKLKRIVLRRFCTRCWRDTET